MESQIKILIVEDVSTDAELVLRSLKRAGISYDSVRVDTRHDFLQGLEQFSPDIILSDHSMPQFDGLSALALAREKSPDTPFIFVSGTIGEEAAIDSLKRGATDYLLKNNLARLPAAVARALQDKHDRAVKERTQQELREAQERFALFMRHMPGAAVMKDLQGRITFVNDGLEKASGKTASELLGRTDEEFRPLHVAQQIRAYEQQVIENRQVVQAIETIPGNDGVHSWLVSKFPIYDANGNMVSVGTTGVDVTERIRADQKVARLSRIHEVLSGINSAIVRIRDRDELFKEVCNIAVRHGHFKLAWIGMVRDTVLCSRPVAWAGIENGYLQKIEQSLSISPDNDAPACSAIRTRQAVISNDIASDPSMASARADAINEGYRSLVALPILLGADVVCVLVLYAPEPDFFDDEEMHLLAELAGDISFALDHIAKEEQITYLAYYDVLTALPNRTLFVDRVNHFVQSENQGRMAVLTLDLERFANVNDTLGRQAGDGLLKLIAERLQGTIASLGDVARIGADTFAIILPDLRVEADIGHILQNKIFNALSRPFLVENQELRLSFKCGIALFPGDGTNADALLKNAEAAMKKAKNMSERYMFYAPQMNAKVAEILDLENKLRIAIVDNQFVLHYQPKVDLATGHITGFEALIRWESPELGRVPPLRFIPILEETGLILEVGMWVLRQVAADQREWRRLGLKPPRIAVNISAIQLRQKDFVDEVLKVIALDKNNPVEIDLEITESVIMENIEEYIPKLKVIRSMGVGVEIDDFGTGYSSLSYIARLPVTVLKIDRSFIDEMVNGDDSVTIVSTIISLAHALNLGVVAEGVETVEQRDLLKMLYCNSMQGYLFSRPLPALEVAKLLGAKK